MLKLELKRIFSKKINVFAIGLALILAVIFSGFAVTSNRYVDENGNASTGIMATRKLTDNRRAWKGTLTEDELGKVIEQNKNAVTQSSEENAIYGTTLQPIDDIRGFIISVLTPDAEYDESVLNQITEENVQEFYDTYHKNMEKMAEEYGKTSVQKKYLEKKYNEIKLPVEYESYSSWDTMIMYVETYSIILAIIVGFICAGIFADDFQTKADAVFFSTKYGRTKAVKTKILAGIVTTVMIYCMGIILLSVICFGIMGTSGMNTPYQMYQAYSICNGIYNHTSLCEFYQGRLLLHLTIPFEEKPKTSMPSDNLRYYRQRNNLTTRQLAEQIGVVPATIVMYENGKHPIPYDVAIKLADVLKIEVSLLYDEFSRFLAAPYTEVLKSVRTALGLSQKAFAEQMGLVPSYYYKLEEGCRRPSRKVYQQMCVALKETNPQTSLLKEYHLQ